MKVIDLSHGIYRDMPLYPGTVKPNLIWLSSLEKDGFRELAFQVTSHTGTHLDCPAHMLEEGETLEGVAIERFIGRGLVVDCSVAGPTIDLQFLLKIDIKQGQPDFILLYTGWSKHWGKDSYYSGYPTLTKRAAAYLTELSLKGLGVDAISVDESQDMRYPIHQTLLQKNILIIENLTNLDLLLGREFLFCCFPLKIEGSDGCPVRAAAQVFSS